MLEKSNSLQPYRRHLDDCPHSSKGQAFTLCRCPIYAYGWLNGAYRKSLRTNDWPRAERRIELLLRTGGETDAILPAAQARTVATAVKNYLADCAARNLKGSSLASYRRTLEDLTKFCGHMSISLLSVDILSRFREARKVAARTQRKEIEYLRAFSAFCLTRGWLQSNPAKQLRAPLVTDLGTLPFSREEVDRLLVACDEIRGMWKSDTPEVRRRAKALVLILIYSGLRVGDVAQLKRSALEPSGHLILRTMKTGAPLKLLLHADAICAIEALPAPGGNPTYFFWSGRGDIDDCSKSLWRTISRVGKLAGVHAHPHRFRDTFAVELLTNKSGIRTVQQLLGHSSIKTTEKHYAHFVPEHQHLLDSATATLDFRPKALRPLVVAPRKNTRRNA